MNLIIIRSEEIDAKGRVNLTDHRAKHIVKVLKSGVGETLRVGIYKGSIGGGTIISCKAKFPFLVELDLSCSQPPPPKSPIDLIVAMPRPIMLKRIISQATTLGVGILHIVNANRVEKSFWEAGITEESELETHVIQGLEQAVDTVPPQITFHKRFKPFVEDYLPSITQRYSHLLVAHPKSFRSLPQLLDKGGGKSLLAIGPEGGWVEYEEEKFRDASFTSFSIGKRILKVDTAVVNIHGRIMSLIDAGELRSALI